MGEFNGVAFVHSDIKVKEVKFYVSIVFFTDTIMIIM